MNYCSNCGARVTLAVPPGDDRPRYMCLECRTIHYQNPNVVVGSLSLWEDRILLCRRAIEPRRGKWTLPAGFLENGESTVEGAVRETYEEARARIGGLLPCTLFSIPFINQVHLMFRASLMDLDFEAGGESLEVRLFGESEIPWADLSFPVVKETLALFYRDRAQGMFRFHVGDILPSGESVIVCTH